MLERPNHYAGVYTAQKKNGTVYFRSSITYRNKHIALGSFTTPLEAQKAYSEASTLLHDSSLTLYDHRAGQMSLSFDKWVALLNFRDHTIYLTNPIYIRKHYFSYFLDPKTELKFSIDDLFYFASHKIIKRGGHLYVNDYGMQITILNRYGIKNYAVYGKDYELINKDPYDFRYENIRILNSFHGVSCFPKRTENKYQSKLHLKGNYVIGYYKDAITAAIAYNKAIDIVKKNGCTKNFTFNYIEEISPSSYASVYTSIRVSGKIRSYLAE